MKYSQAKQMVLIARRALKCARQRDKWTKPYAALITDTGERLWVQSRGRFNHLTTVEDHDERFRLFYAIAALPVGGAVEARDMDECSHRTAVKTIWNRIDVGWQKVRESGPNRHGYSR